MLRGIVNRLRGQVRIRAECAFPERVLNLCGARDLSFWDLEWESAAAFTCRISRRDYAVLRQAAGRLGCTLTVVDREGAPFFLSRFRGRQALLAGLVGGGLALFLGSFFIWDFQIEGNETVPEERILRALENAGCIGMSYRLDVVEKEPLEPANPLSRLKDSSRLIITPHLAWASVEARRRCVEEAYRNIDAFLRGEDRNIVNP